MQSALSLCSLPVSLSLLDFAICFEALCSKEHEGVDSVTHKLKVRFARLVKDSFIERKIVFDEMGSFYAARSKVVHGNNIEKQKALRKMDITKVEDYLRDAIKLYVMKTNETNVNHDQIIELLDLG